MSSPIQFIGGALALCALLIVGCGKAAEETSEAPATEAAGKVAVAEVKPAQAATTQPTNNNVTGTVTFTELPDGKVKVTAQITGLTASTTHGFHIHQTGDLSAPDLMSTGGHYNPDGHPHAGPTTQTRHAGDLGNITSDASGTAMYEITVEGISIGGATNDIIGKPVIIHAQPDDLTSQPTGNAGGRIAGGLIQMKP